MAHETRTADEVATQLRMDEAYAAWLTDLDAAGPPEEPVALPKRDDALALLGRLGVPAAHAAEALTAAPSPEATPELWWLLERCVNLLHREMGGFDSMRPWPALPSALGVHSRYFYPWVYVATLPATRRWHTVRGIPDDVSWATLADLGLHMSIRERMYGEGGLNEQTWLHLHFRGAIYALGRLQFNRSRIRYDAEMIESTAGTFRPGDASLGVHIPETGPLSAEACDASFARVRGFFDRHFPEDHVTIATCGSWLLDEQLAEYLPADSNIVRFQQRFQRVPGSRIADDAILRFVFRSVSPSLDALPQRTTLERAVVSHLRAGKHWYSRSGWVELP